MPRYLYFCASCGKESEVFHSMSDDLDHCPNCNSMDLHRKPQMVHFKSEQPQGDSKVGDLTKRAIEENRAILKEDKKIRVEYKDEH